MNIDFLVKLRDACAMIQEACDDALEKTNPTFKNEPEKIAWVKSSGAKGPYERYPAYQQQPTQTVEYTHLLESIKNSKGRFQHGGLFYWIFPDRFTIGRKPA